MDLLKIFEMQRKLDDHIMDEHPELRNQSNLDWKILALQVELGECANEWRGFKKWSKDQEPRTTLKCKKCNGNGYIEWFSGSLENNNLQQEMASCEECRGIGEIKEINPLLEEYVDCLHFILSIGLEEGWTPIAVDLYLKSESITNQFLGLFNKIGDFSIYKSQGNYYKILEIFVGLGEMLGFTWEEIKQAYFAKNAVNHARQEDGY